MLAIFSKLPVLESPEKRTGDVRMNVGLAELEVGHLLVSNVETQGGMLLVHAGATVTPTLLQRLNNFAAASGVREPIQVLIRRSSGTPANSAKA